MAELIRAARDIPATRWQGPVSLGSTATPMRYAMLHVLQRQAPSARSLADPEVREEILAALRKAKRKGNRAGLRTFPDRAQEEARAPDQAVQQ